jgi:hypothetical protein
MPVEIKELVIRVAVSDRPAPAPGAQASGGGGGGGDKDAIVAECVEQVMRVIHGMKER